MWCHIITVDSLKSLVTELATNVKEQGTGTRMLENDRYASLPITPENFKEIKETVTPKKIAYVDGGNVELLRATNYVVEFNRLYYTIFEGKKKIAPQLEPVIEFFSCVTSTVKTDKDSNNKRDIHYRTSIFPHNTENKDTLPLSDDLSFLSTDREIATSNQRALIHSVGSIARQFAEKSFACKIVKDELSRGDILVLDGSLHKSFRREHKYLQKLFELGQEKGVTICGLTKTSTLFTDSGSSLLGAIYDISENVKHDRWYIPVAAPKSDDPRGTIFVIKLHPYSEHIFRFEILADQYDQMNQQEIDEVFASLAINSNDLSMIGYPYGLIDADTHARVRQSDKDYYRNILLSEISQVSQWKKSIMNHSKTHMVHNDLNLAVG